MQLLRLTERSHVIDDVEFVCARCGLDRSGVVVRTRRWYTVGPVLLVRLGEKEPVVRCNRCAHESDVGVLGIPTTTELTRLLDDATIAALTITVRASDGDQQVRQRACAVLDDASMGPRWLDYAVQTLSPSEAADRLRRLRDELTPHGKQGLLLRIASVASGDDSLTHSQRSAIVDIGAALGMAPAHVHGTLAVSVDHVLSS